MKWDPPCMTSPLLLHSDSLSPSSSLFQPQFKCSPGQECLLHHSWESVQSSKKKQPRNQEIIILKELRLNNQHRNISAPEASNATKWKVRAGNTDMYWVKSSFGFFSVRAYFWEILTIESKDRVKSLGNGPRVNRRDVMEIELVLLAALALWKVCYVYVSWQLINSCKIKTKLYA